MTDTVHHAIGTRIIDKARFEANRFKMTENTHHAAGTHIIEKSRIQARLDMLRTNHEISSARNARINAVMQSEIIVTPKHRRGHTMTEDMKEFVDDVYRSFAIMVHDYLLAVGFVPWCIETTASGAKCPRIIPIANYSISTTVQNNTPSYIITSGVCDARVFFTEPPVLSSSPQGTLAGIEREVWRIERLKENITEASAVASRPRVFTQRTVPKKPESSVLYAELGVFTSGDETAYIRNEQEQQMLAKGLKLASVNKDDGICLPQDHTLVQQTHPKIFVPYQELDARLAEIVCAAFGVPYAFIHTTTRYSSDKTANKTFDYTVRGIKREVQAILEEAHAQIFGEIVSVALPFIPSLSLEDIFMLADRELISKDTERMLAISACGLHHSEAFNASEMQRKRKEAPSPIEQDERVRTGGKKSRGGRPVSAEREIVRGPSSGDR